MEKHEIPQSGQAVSGPRFGPGTSRIRSTGPRRSVVVFIKQTSVDGNVEHNAPVIYKMIIGMLS
jgi:hypothetical protein